MITENVCSVAVTVTLPAALTTIETTTTVLECTFTSTGSDIEITWYKGGSVATGTIVIQAGGGHVFPRPGFTRHGIQDQSSLVITDTQLSDAGTYWCEVYAGGDGADAKSISLTVTGGPGFLFLRRTFYDMNVLAPAAAHVVDVMTEWSSRRTFNEEEIRLCFSPEASVTKWGMRPPQASPPNKPTISITDGNNPSNAGDRIRLKCTSSSGSPTPSYTWQKDNQPLPVLPRYQLNSDNSRLTIHPSHKDDNGKIFTCHVSNVKGSEEEDITIEIRYAPGNPVCTYQTTTSFSYLLDDEMGIRCRSTDGSPLATLHWYHGNNQIQSLSPSTDVNTVTLDYTWNLKRNDNGVTYMCEATNIVQTTPLTCQLGPFNIYFPSESVTLSGITNPVKEGETKILTCTTSTSNPASQISWLKDNNVWTANTYESITSDVTRDGDYNGEISEQQMTISIQAEHNSKSYQCQSSHSDFTGPVTSIVIELTVYFKPPSVSLSGYSTVVKSGDMLTLTCETDSSNPAAVISWYKDGDIFTGNSDETISDYTEIDGDNGGTIRQQYLKIRLQPSHNM
uniref:Nephrin-like n=1 Tax=Saccoglossus kowalevskii TaxID=10224 RepID=A0ABM0MX47_SACKO